MFGFSSNKSSSESSGRSFVDPSQAPFLNFLRNMALGQAQGAMGQQGALQGVSQGLLGQGQQFLGNLQGLGSPAMQQQQMGQLTANLGQAFQQQVLPGIRRGAVATGTLGGGRQGVAEGVAAGQFGQALTSGFTDIMANAERMRLGAAQTGLGSLGSMMGIAGAPYTGAHDWTKDFQDFPVSALDEAVTGRMIRYRKCMVDSKLIANFLK